MKKYLVVKKDGREESSEIVTSNLDIQEFCESLSEKNIAEMEGSVGEYDEDLANYIEEFCTVEEEDENLWTVGLNEEEWLEISEIK